MILSAKHTVSDFELWKTLFDEHAATRKEHGATGHRLAQSLDDPNALTVLVMFPDRAAAEGFLADPSLQDTMARAGVASAPVFEFLDVTEEVPY